MDLPRVVQSAMHGEVASQRGLRGVEKDGPWGESHIALKCPYLDARILCEVTRISTICIDQVAKKASIMK